MTLYIPIDSPPTPAPSPGPQASFSECPAHLSRKEFAGLTPSLRRQYLASIISDCNPSELLFISNTIAPLLKRDFIRDLPPELALHILNFIDDPRTLARASRVSKHWHFMLSDPSLWRSMCLSFQFDGDEARAAARARHEVEGDDSGDDALSKERDQISNVPPMDPALNWLIAVRKRPARKEFRSTEITAPKPRKLPVPSSPQQDPCFSYREHFKSSYNAMMNWRNGGVLLRAHRTPAVPSECGVITSVALDAAWIIVGLDNCKIHVFDADTGVMRRSLVGHEQGVWAVNLISRGGFWGGPPSVCLPPLELPVVPQLRKALGLDKPYQTPPSINSTEGNGKPGDVCCASEGWGQPNALVVSGGCDKTLRVWDIKSGCCIHILRGHTSTIRCIKVLHNRPIAVTGSRDTTLRVWDVQHGRQLHVLCGHEMSVRCLDVCGNRAVSGSYDTTCRLWDIDTGQCLHVLRGHFHEIYSIAFDGVRIASGGLDTTVRVWDAATGKCLALLQGHTALVCQLQLSPTILATGGSDGRIIIFCLSTFTALHRIAAHDSSVTSLQFDARFLVTGGNDGRVRLFEIETGNYIRELNERSDSVWKVAYRGDVCAIMCKRAGKPSMEIWSFRSSG